MASPSKLSNLGVKYPCYAEFKCPHCSRIWESVFAWRDVGQPCNFCNAEVMPRNLQRSIYYYCEPCLIKTKGLMGRWIYKYCEEGNHCKTCGQNSQPYKIRQVQVGKYVVSKPEEVQNGNQQELCERLKKIRSYCRHVAEKPVPEAKVRRVPWQLRVPPSEVAPGREGVIQEIPGEFNSRPEGAAAVLSYDQDFPTISSSQSSISSSSSSAISGIRTRFPKPKQRHKTYKKQGLNPEAAQLESISETPLTSTENLVGNLTQDDRISSSNAQGLESPPSERVRPATPFPHFPRRQQRFFDDSKPESQSLSESKMISATTQTFTVNDAKMTEVNPGLQTNNGSVSPEQSVPDCNPPDECNGPNSGFPRKTLLIGLFFLGLSVGLSTILNRRGN